MSYFRSTVEEMAGYVPGEQPAVANIVKLNTNENPYPPSPDVLAILQKNKWFLNRYPDPSARLVREAAAEVVGGEPDEILVGNGSDDILTILIRACVDQGDVVACLEPSYSLYPVLAQIQGSCLQRIPVEEDFSLPKFRPDLVGRASLVVLTSPNAPIGASLDHERIAEWCREFDGLVVVDEAYADFADVNATGLVRTHLNCVVTRTLSKAYSLAGIRLGYAYAAASVIRQLAKVKDSYNVNAITQALAVAALRDQKTLAENVGRVRETRERLTQSLRELGFAVLKSDANFLFVKPPFEALEYCAGLRDAAIIVRHFPGFITGAFVRISIGTDAEIDRLIEVSESILKERHGA